MKDPNDVLREKEEELARVRQEIESLEIAASLLSDEPPADECVQRVQKKESAVEKAVDRGAAAEATGTDGLFASAVPSRSRFWNVLKRGK